MNEENQVYFIDSDQLPPAALERKHKLEQDPSFRTDYMKYLDDMEIIDSDIKDKVLKAMDEYDYDSYAAADVERALSKETCNIEDFKALLSPAAAPYLEQMARKAENETKKHFGNTVYIFTPIYIANYCQNYCIYCGFNCYNNIHRKKLSFEEIEHGNKRVWPYRFDAQERALMAGMRGAGFSALLGLDDFRKDALATALHVYYLNRKYPHAELSLSCPRLRPIINNDKINPRDVGEKQLCQVLCAYRLFLPFVGITVSSRESAQFRNGITKICATKVSAGVSTGIGDHESKYTGKEDGDAGDEQFEINDNRSFDRMYKDMEDGGLQPVVNEYIYV